MRNLQTLNKQQGLATVLIVLLVGVSMTAMAMGLARSVKSTQHKQTAVHAATHAQSAAWSAVHIFKEYLKTLDYDHVAAMPIDTTIPMAVTGSAPMAPPHATTNVHRHPPGARPRPDRLGADNR